MSSCPGNVESFLATHGWAGATATPVAGDASARRYTRLARPGGSAILMESGPGSAGEIRRFVGIAEHLRDRGLSAPAILAEAADNGLLLVEDLGTAMLDVIVDRDPSAYNRLYSCAIDALARLQPAPLPARTKAPDAAELAEWIRPAYDWYRRRLCKRTDTDRSGVVIVELAEALDRHAGGARVLALRDFHAGNLVWLSHRDGVARIGLLDFQDAFAAHPAYDLVSLTRDVRRDVPAATQAAATRRLADATGLDMTALSAAAAVLAVQRNLRILGVFARLAARDGKPAYLAHLPRTWRLLCEDLDHPALGTLRGLILDDLPAPDRAPRPAA